MDFRSSVTLNKNMNQITSLYLATLKQAIWQPPDHIEFPSHLAKQWLLEAGSLSRRMANSCHQLTVEVLNNQIMPAASLQSDERALLAHEQYLLRQVVISGDQQPWVLGHSIIPHSSLHHPEFDLSQQGDTPLGLTLFSAEHAERDGLQVAWITTPSGPLLARRSRLAINHKPILVSEVFLASAPIYAKESVL